MLVAFLLEAISELSSPFSSWPPKVSMEGSMLAGTQLHSKLCSLTILGLSGL